MNEWLIIRQQTLERDNHSCQSKNCKKDSLDLEVHPIIPRCKGGKDILENLITYCHKCHRKIAPSRLYIDNPTRGLKRRSITISSDTYRKLTKLGTLKDSFSGVLRHLIVEHNDRLKEVCR